MPQLTDSIHDMIVLAIRAGSYDHIAAQHAGITVDTFLEWLDRGKRATRGRYRRLYVEVSKASAASEVSAVIAWRRAIDIPGNWRAAMEFLRHKYPERWRPADRVEVDGALQHLHRAAQSGKPMQTLADLGLDDDDAVELGRLLSQSMSRRRLPAPDDDDVIDVEAS